VRFVDIKPKSQWYQVFDEFDNQVMDLKNSENAKAAVAGRQQVYNLAAYMGGMGFIETHKAECMLSVLINTNLLEAARAVGVERFFFASSALLNSDLTVMFSANDFSIIFIYFFKILT
jgi:nucleoside-diphosphate-sugar epimerase